MNSLKIEQHGRYQLTPLYDVISAYPIVANRQLEWRELKMAMSLKGKNRHYLWHTIQLRHWFTMAEKCQFSTTIMQDIINDVCDNMEDVISQVTQILPSDFPSYMANSIFSGMRRIKNRCVAS